MILAAFIVGLGLLLFRAGLALLCGLGRAAARGDAILSSFRREELPQTPQDAPGAPGACGWVWSRHAPYPERTIMFTAGTLKTREGVCEKCGRPFTYRLKRMTWLCPDCGGCRGKFKPRSRPEYKNVRHTRVRVESDRTRWEREHLLRIAPDLVRRALQYGWATKPKPLTESSTQ